MLLKSSLRSDIWGFLLEAATTEMSVETFLAIQNWFASYELLEEFSQPD